MFSLICARINGWVNNGEAGDLRRHRAHYDIVMSSWSPQRWSLEWNSEWWSSWSWWIRACRPDSSAWLPLLRLQSWCLIFEVSSCNSFEGWAPIDELYGCLIFKLVADIDYLTGYQDNSSNNGQQGKMPHCNHYNHHDQDGKHKESSLGLYISLNDGLIERKLAEHISF